MRRLDGDERARKYKQMGGTNTPYRRRWQRQMRDGRVGGYYHAMQGTTEQMTIAPDGRICCQIVGDSGAVALCADYVIDCTGLVPDITQHAIYRDLLEHTGAQRNPLGRLEVERHFEVKGAASGSGTLYASGAATLGGYFPGVDTFLGLQVAAQEITDDLARRGFARRLTPGRSIREWFKWLTNSPV
jgi:hypothetical protein